MILVVNIDESTGPNQLIINDLNSLFFFIIFYILTSNCYKHFHIYMTQDLDVGSHTMPNFANASTMAAPFIQGGDVAQCNFTNCVYEQSSFIQGRYTNILRGVQQEAAMSLSARKLLNFDENM
jgi:hypothetical protein